jgi:prolyl-tRNA editing enzyme YbaK/EbsC (Cys-tRNA(Pro) deacylase)
VVEAGAHHASVRLRTKDLVRLNGTLVADLCDG